MVMPVWLTLSIAGLLSTSDLSIPTRIPLTTPLRNYGFDLIREENGVKAYKHPSSDVIRIAAEGRFEAPPALVEHVLLDYEGQVGAISRLSEAEILDRGDQWLLVYEHLNLPVVSDRDYVLYVRFGVEGDATWVSYAAVANTGPGPKDGVVRVVHHQGSWQLKALDGGSATMARFQAEIDLGGLLPMWMARAGAGEELPALFSQIAGLLNLSEPGRSSCISNCR
jgi:hypothetical protein